VPGGAAPHGVRDNGTVALMAPHTWRGLGLLPFSCLPACAWHGADNAALACTQTKLSAMQSSLEPLKALVERLLSDRAALVHQVGPLGGRGWAGGWAGGGGQAGWQRDGCGAC
jgi:hypothetical protein